MSELLSGLERRAAARPLASRHEAQYTVAMSPNEILALQRTRPFAGLRVHVSDGTSYEVLHPENMTVTRTIVFIAMRPGPDGVPDRGVYCDPVHITRIEPLHGAVGKRAGKRRR